jgi:hypothetical protein
LTVLKAGPGSAFAVATRASEKMKDFIVVVVDGSSYKKRYQEYRKQELDYRSTVDWRIESRDYVKTVLRFA